MGGSSPFALLLCGGGGFFSWGGGGGAVSTREMLLDGSRRRPRWGRGLLGWRCVLRAQGVAGHIFFPLPNTPLDRGEMSESSRRMQRSVLCNYFMREKDLGRRADGIGIFCVHAVAF